MESSRLGTNPGSAGGLHWELRLDGDPQVISHYRSYQKRNKSNPDGETRHHAEQRMVDAIENHGDQDALQGKSDVKLLAMGPSKWCCPGCYAALTQSGDIGKIRTDLQQEPS